ILPSGEDSAIGEALTRYIVSTPEETHAADLAHRATSPHLAARGHRVRRRRAAGRAARLRRGAGRLRLLAPRRRWGSVLHRRRRSQALRGGGAHAQRDALAGGKAGADGPGTNDGGPFVPQDGGRAADPDAQ